MPEAVKILSEVILRPKLEQEEVGALSFPLCFWNIEESNGNVFIYTCSFQITDASMAVTFDLEDLHLRPEKDVLLTEMIHAVSFIDLVFPTVKCCTVIFRFTSKGFASIEVFSWHVIVWLTLSPKIMIAHSY